MSTASIILAAFLGAACVALWLPNVVDVVGLLRIPARRGARRPSDGGSFPSLLVLVPAHNEEIIVEHCVRSLVGMDYPADRRRIVVIADNCSDGTARIARAGGAECLERFDTVQRGKPRALAWALEQLPMAEFDACVVVDADTVVERDFARGLARCAPLADIAVQAYIGTLNERDNWLTRLAGVLARCRYEVTYVIRDAAGLNCPLTGNGMCIGRSLLVPNGWQAFSLTENWELYARYAAAGVPIRFARTARLFTQQVRSMSQGRTQRARWLAGRTSVLREYGRAILRGPAPIAEKFATLVELGALSPVLQLVAAIGVALLALLAPPPARWALAVAALTSLASPALATIAVVTRHPERAATMLAFLRLPAYALWRLSVAAATLVIPGSTEWRKTEHHSM